LIIEHREFSSLQDFIQKLPENYRKETVIRPLIEVGAFDNFDPNRRKLVENLKKLLDFNSVFQTDLFSETSTNLKFAYDDYEDYSNAEKYQMEFDLMGVAVTEHPLMRIARTRQGNFTEVSQLTAGQKATILVQLTHLKTHRTKNGATMAFLNVTDTKDELDVTMFPESYHHFLPEIEVNDFYLITGKVSERNDRLQLVAEGLVKIVETDKNFG
jgi:DNA polymerase-3 subunit alpha